MDFYDDNYKYTELAMELDEKAMKFLDELFSDYLDKGCLPRDISDIIINAVLFVESINLV